MLGRTSQPEKLDRAEALRTGPEGEKRLGKDILERLEEVLRLTTDAKERVVPVYCLGFSAEAADRLIEPTDSSPAGAALASGDLQYERNVPGSRRLGTRLTKTGHYRSQACAPIIASGEAVALVRVDSTSENAFDKVDLLHLKRLAELAGLIITAANCVGGRWMPEARAVQIRDASKQEGKGGAPHGSGRKKRT